MLSKSLYLSGKKKSANYLDGEMYFFNTLGWLEPAVHVRREEDEGAEHKALFSPS